MRGGKIRYAPMMASDRMMQAIGSLERAIARLEQAAAAAPPSESSITSPIAAAEARAALQSLDLLIADLKGRGHG